MKKVLMIFYSFAPQNNCAAIPNTKLVKYLGHEDVEITLVTNALIGDMEVDESLLPENVKKMRRINVNRSKLFLSTVAAQRTRITNSGAKLKMKSETRPFRAWCVSLLKYGYFTLSGLDWVTAGLRTVKKELKGETFDVVYSSYPAKETHLIAKYLRDQGVAQKWIADFRDPMYYEEYDQGQCARLKRQQHKLEKAADRITIVSEGAMEKFDFPDVPKSKITYIPNGFDPDDFDVSGMSGNEQKGKLRIFYAGTLYAGRRDLSVMFRAFAELAEAGQVKKEDLSFEYAGNEWPVFQGFAEKYGLADQCINYGYITRQRVMQIMSEIDCSIVCTHNTKTDKGVVTGKVFELLLVAKPIIAIVGGDLPDSELGRIVRQCEAGIVYEQAAEEADYPALKQWLHERYQEKMANGKLAASLNEKEREKYSYQNIAHQLYELMAE